MAMSLKLIADLLRENGLSPIAYPWDTPERPLRLLVPLEYGAKLYMLILRQDNGEGSWKIFELAELQSSAM